MSQIVYAYMHASTYILYLCFSKRIYTERGRDRECVSIMLVCIAAIIKTKINNRIENLVDFYCIYVQRRK